ncbi:hypothetical protein V2J09_014551 [Rumex salicifolius]
MGLDKHFPPQKEEDIKSKMLKALLSNPIPTLISPQQQQQSFSFGASSCCGFRLCIPRVGPNSTRCTSRRRQELQISAQADDSQSQQLNLSVLRFTFGIPGLDESYLPRWIGYGFGSLIIVNHLVGSRSTLTSTQLVSEALGLSLAAFSITLPYLGKFLKGAKLVDQATLPEGADQIFIMSQNMSDNLKEDLAWATYVLLRNTNSVSALISINDVLCVRGYWRTSENLSTSDSFDWFGKQIQRYGLSDLKDSLYFSQSADSELEELLPKGVGSVLIQPISQASSKENEKVAGFVLVASTITYAYSDRDRSWIKAVASKFGGYRVQLNPGNIDDTSQSESRCL